MSMDPQTLLRRRLLAAFLSGFPLLLALVLTVINPRYMGLMVLPGANRVQPLGWLLTFALVALTGLAYLAQRASIIRGERSTGARIRSAALYAGSVVFLITPAASVVILGPPVLVLVQSGLLFP